MALHPKVSVDPRLAIDNNSWPSKSTETVTPTAYKYLNAIEVPGSISLLVPFGGLTDIVKVSSFRGATQNTKHDYRSEVYA